MRAPRQTRADTLKASPDRRSAHAIDMNAFMPAMLTNLAQKITTSASAAYRPKFGVGITEWRIIALLGAEPWTAPVQICEATGLDKAAVSRSLRELVEADLVEMQADGLAQRRLPFALTAKGIAIHNQIVAYALEREERMLADFSIEERALFRAFVGRMQQSVDEIVNEGH
jgi:DNA-binding MarR family transcriptional regulator